MINQEYNYRPGFYIKYPYKTEPYEHQRKFLQQTWLRPYYALFWEMGAGKSKAVIDTFAALFLHNLLDGVLILAPNGVYRNWTTKEIPEHLPDSVPVRTKYWSSKKAATKSGKLEYDRFVTNYTRDTLAVFVVNIEALVSDNAMQACRKFLQTHAAMIVMDESTRIKTPTALRTRRAIQLAKLAKYKRILSGSPITTSPLDLYSQCDFLNPAVADHRKKLYLDNPLGFSNFASFRARYTILKDIVVGGQKRTIPVSYVNTDELNAKLKAFSSRVTKAECLDLPPKVYTTRTIPLTSLQKEYYKDMAQKAKLFIRKEGEEFTDKVMAKIALTKIEKLLQISSGFVITDDRRIVGIENDRIKELMATINEIDTDEGKIIIWSHYTHLIEIITKSLTDKNGTDSVVTYYGDTDVEERERAKKLFQDTSSPVKFFVGNPATAGMGITLTAANTVIYYSNSYNLEHRLQSEYRAHRLGQQKKVLYIDFISTPMDKKVLQLLKAKKNIADLIVDGSIIEWLDLDNEEIGGQDA